jgi:hypothetical protein
MSEHFETIEANLLSVLDEIHDHAEVGPFSRTSTLRCCT